MAKIGVLLPVSAQKDLFSEESRKKLEGLGEVKWNDKDQQLTEEEAAAFLQDCDIAVGSWRTAIPTKTILDRAPELKLWEHAAGSVKHFFTDDLRGRDIAIASCAPAIATTVSEMVLGELIVGLRRIIPNSQQNRTTQGSKPANKGYLAKSTIGVVGASQVGRQVIGLLRPFGVKVLVYDPYLTPEGAAQLGAEKVESLVELCSRSDAVTLHTPKTPDTYHLLKAEHFQAMKDDTVFINSSRGDCIDEEALIAELQKGRLFAFLDVSNPEPAALDNPIRNLPNAIYTSHLAGGPSIHIGALAVADIEAFLSGGQPRMVVTWEMLPRLA